MHYVCGVEYDSGYRLRVTFEDDSVKVVDLKDYLDGEVFEPLTDLQRFKTARLNPDLDTVVWANGADMSPDFLYEIGVPIEEERQPTRRVAEQRDSYKTGKKLG